MSRKAKVKKRKRRGRRTTPAVREQVKAMRARGLSEDRISFELALSKNTLRARHAPDLDRGRELARSAAEAAERAQLTTRQQEIFNVVSGGFGTEWETPDLGNLLRHGARTIAESFEMYVKMKGQTLDDLDGDLAAVANVVRNLENRVAHGRTAAI